MNARRLATEFAALAALSLWVYAGAALLVATFGDGASLSFGVVAGVVALSYGLGLLLAQLDVSDVARRRWGAVLSFLLLYLILRIEIAGEPYVWELAWLGDLLTSPGTTLEGHAGGATASLLLTIAWFWGVLRGSTPLTSDLIMAETSLGLVAIFLAAAFAGAADAPDALRWLPPLYLASVLFALALAHLREVNLDQQRPFLGAWGLWVGGSVAIIAAASLLPSLVDPPSIAIAGDAIVLAIQGIALAIAAILAPPLLAIGWVTQQLFGWLATGEEAAVDQAPPQAPLEQDDGDGDTPQWARILAYALGGGTITLILILVFVTIAFAFRRSQKATAPGDEVRETMEPYDTAGSARSLLADALARLRGLRGGTRSRDAIGKLYLTMLGEASQRGLARPPAVTPLEFAPQLEALFASTAPNEISSAYSEARYARRPPSSTEVDTLRDRWRHIDREPGGE